MSYPTHTYTAHTYTAPHSTDPYNSCLGYIDIHDYYWDGTLINHDLNDFN